MQQKINFNAGPAQMPPEVLHEAAIAIRKYKKTGLSILELPHRGSEFREIVDESKSLLYKISGLTDDYDMVWLQGGGRGQFYMVPMNFLPANGTAGFLDSGYWSAEAANYASYYGSAPILASTKADHYRHLPTWPEIPADLSYLHMATNNTIYGTQWHHIPETGSTPLVADMSSDIFSVKRDLTRFSMFYAAAQKNLGIAGVTLAVIKKEFLEKANGKLPPMLSYQAQIKENSVLNTPNVFGVYVSLLMLRWIDERGVDRVEADNRRKAALLYDFLDNNEIFRPNVSEKDHRSLMNICFTAKTEDAEKRFLELAEEKGITGIKGHRYTGGFRVSLYNAMSIEETTELVTLMRNFDPNPVVSSKLKRP